MPNKSKNQNQKPNAFICFAQAIKPQLLREGYDIKNMQDLVAVAGDRWKDLDEYEKEFYKEQAKIEKENRRWDPPKRRQEREDKRDCTGELIASRVDTTKLNEQRRRREREEVARQWPEGEDVTQEKFYFVAFSITLELPDHQTFLPCELGVVEYSLDRGVERMLHKFINPGPIPLGHRFEAMSKSDNTHKIPPEGMAAEGDTYERIYDELYNFIMRGRKVIPPIFAKVSEAHQTAQCLKWLADKAGRQHRLKKVYELEGLLLDLDCHLLNEPPNFSISKSIATDFLSTTAFDYEKNTRCSFHEQEDVKYCALGVVRRYSYCLSDYLCIKHRIPLTQRHLPNVSSVDVQPVTKQGRQRDENEMPYTKVSISKGQQTEEPCMRKQGSVSEQILTNKEPGLPTQPSMGRGRGRGMGGLPRRPGEKPRQPGVNQPEVDTGVSQRFENYVKTAGRGTARDSPTSQGQGNSSLSSQGQMNYTGAVRTTHPISESRRPVAEPTEHPRPLGRGMALKNNPPSGSLRAPSGRGQPLSFAQATKSSPGKSRSPPGSENTTTLRRFAGTAPSAPPPSQAPQPPSTWVS